MESSNNKIDNLIIVVISLVLIVCFLTLNNFNSSYPTEEHKSVTTYLKSNKFDIDNEIKKYEKEYEVVSVNKINNTLTNIVFYNQSGNLDSIVLENESGNILTLDDLIKKDSKDLFFEKVNELLQLKYASFIVDGINTFPGTIVYEFKNNELIIYYKNFVFNPAYNKDVFLHVNYNEIDEFLTFKHRLDDEYENEDGFKYDPNKTTVAISFDDGPNGAKTQRVLKVLENNKMCATFFMVGNKMYNQRDTLNQVLLTHSEIGSHSYSHINMKRVKFNKVVEELNKTNDIFKDITGQEFTLVRPPYGAYTDDIIKNFNQSFILWNVDTNDWRYKDVDYLVDHILTHIEDGNIILMHDTYETSVQTVEKVLPILYAKDIQVVSVSKLAELRNVNLESGKAYHYFK